jgi:hypothetical protein
VGARPVRTPECYQRIRKLHDQYAGAVPTLERLDAAALRQVVTTFRDTVRAHAPGINRLNVYPVPDGDTGTNMARTLDAVVAELDGAPHDLDATCDAISHGSLMGARGNSGVILSQIMRGVAATLKDTSPIVESSRERIDAGAHKAAEALSAAATGAYQAVLKPIEGTILTVVRESAEAAREAAAAGGTLVEVLRAARDAGRSALDRTPEMLPVLKDAGVVDAGGAGFLLFLDAALHVVDGEPLPEPDPDDHGPSLEQLEVVAHRHALDGGVDVSELRYEVMYFCELPDVLIDDFKHRWGEIGDSIVVVGGGGVWNCHVHTNDIGAAVEVALDLGGRPRQIRVTDLFDEVAEEHALREAALHGGPTVRTAIVAVSSGPGLTELFAGLGVQRVVAGGQTLNPSTAELLAAVEAAPSDAVVVLPNNKNIVPVAEQLDALTSKSVTVLPTVSMPEGLAALVAYDPDAAVASNLESMRAAADGVRTGEVTRAVRASRTDAGEVAAGDWIGLVRGDGVVAIGTSASEAAIRLLEHLLRESGDLVTLVVGADADPDDLAAVVGWLADDRSDVEVEVHEGGQPLYPFLIGVE